MYTNLITYGLFIFFPFSFLFLFISYFPYLFSSFPSTFLKTIDNLCFYHLLIRYISKKFDTFGT